MSRYLFVSVAAVAVSFSLLRQTYGQSPSDRGIVDIPPAAQRFALTDQDKTTLRKYVRTRSGATTGSPTAAINVSLGYKIPDGVELHALPGEVYREAPRLVGYRFIQVGRDTYIVDRSNRAVVGKLD
jgi:hypothetical protein